ncbi:MAG: hypothetical protein ACREPM_02140 [Gemmatimonadaceae bacterium]
MNDKQITALVGYVVMALAIVLLVGGAVLPSGFFKGMSTVTSATIVAVAAFDRWLWRWRPLQGWFVKRPYVGGTWRVRLQSSWIPNGKDQPVDVTGYLVVRQTFLRLSVRLLTKESSSRLRGAEVIGDGDDAFSIAAVYVNEPKYSVRERSPIHHGALVLAVKGSPPSILEGHYWTDRATSGEMQASQRRLDVYDTYDGAEAAYLAEGVPTRESQIA